MKYIVCASGPSMLQIDLEPLKCLLGWKIIVVNNTWQLLPWADVLYAGDAEWWDKYGLDAMSFGGEKWTSDAMIATIFGINHIDRQRRPGLSHRVGSINSGGNSGYQAINLAFHFGAKKIVMLGYDMHRDSGGHWHGEHEGMLSAPQKHIDKWIQMFDPLAADLKRAKVEVINATPGTALHCFPTESLKSALR